MAVIFCTACGARNRRKSLNCVRCSEVLQTYERVNTREWEPEQELPGAIDELTPPSTWQRIRARPVLSGSIAALVLAVGLAGAWLFAFITRPPECVEFESYGCSVIVLERRVDENVLQSEADANYEGSTYQQAEVIDWLRLLVIARESDGSLDLARLFDVSAGGVNRLRSCKSLRDCSAINVSEDVDYDGLSGPVGLTSQGVGQRVRLSSDSIASRSWILEGRVDVGSLPDHADERYFEEIHLIGLTPDSRVVLEQTAARFRKELDESGLQIRVRVMFDAHSRSSSIPAARILTGPREGSLSVSRLSTSVELLSREDRAPWIGSLSTTNDHLISASRFELAIEQLAVIVFDCDEHLIVEQSYFEESRPRVETMCFDSTKYREVMSQSSQLGRVTVVASARESQIVASVRSLTPETANPIFLARV